MSPDQVALGFERICEPLKVEVLLFPPYLTTAASGHANWETTVIDSIIAARHIVARIAMGISCRPQFCHIVSCSMVAETG